MYEIRELFQFFQICEMYEIYEENPNRTHWPIA
jgi:hypothetical protein